ncbi:hypothetical protein SEPCBS119000_005287 [Sporothrix epigloea]|uniref:Pentatricopeptide repeat protein n=1 Tax=Sporothrix epigloea TaxID=1892477 RepID=A0ABP0E0J2_9PEZI
MYIRNQDASPASNSNRFNHTSAATAALPTPGEHETTVPPASTYFASSPASHPNFWQPRRPTLNKNELRSFVDPPGDGDSVDEHLQFIRDPYMRRYAQAEEPEVVVSHKSDVEDYPTWKDVAKADSTIQKLIHELNIAVGMRLRNPRRVSASNIYDIYSQLPGTRMSHVPASLRHQALKALGMVEKKDAQSMLRYFAVIADVKDSGYALWMAEWNAAISFASRYVGSSSTTEVEAAVNLWREMEQEASVQGNAVTFNILFDVASKAGNFTLAEMIYKEMEKRGLRYNRYHHVSLIHFFGLKMDADGIRVAYQDMVNAGEMIDVVVLNCVMSGFLRCGEEDAAQRVYERMQETFPGRPKSKTLTASGECFKETCTAAINGENTDATTFFTPFPGASASLSPNTPNPSKDHTSVPRSLDTANFASQKVMTNVLLMLAKVSKGDTALRAEYQLLVPTWPDLATYRILINHYATRLGDLSSCTRFLSDMKQLHIPLHGAIFLALFKGFAMHGGRPGTLTDWSEQRLRSIWSALLKALDDEVEGLYISTWLVMWALRAFDRCSTPEMVFKAYSSLSSRWDPSEADADFTISVLHRLLKSRQPHAMHRKDDTNEDKYSVRRKSRRGPSGDTSTIRQLGSRSFG